MRYAKSSHCTGTVAAKRLDGVDKKNGDGQLVYHFSVGGRVEMELVRIHCRGVSWDRRACGVSLALSLGPGFRASVVEIFLVVLAATELVAQCRAAACTSTTPETVYPPSYESKKALNAAE